MTAQTLYSPPQKENDLETIGEGRGSFWQGSISPLEVQIEMILQLRARIILQGGGNEIWRTMLTSETFDGSSDRTQEGSFG